MKTLLVVLMFCASTVLGQPSTATPYRGETGVAVSPVSNITSTVINWDLSNNFRKTLGVSTTFTFTNQHDGQLINVTITGVAGQSYTATWPTVTWSGGVTPTQKTGDTTDVYSFLYSNGITYGHYWRGLSLYVEDRADTCLIWVGGKVYYMLPRP